MSGDIATADDSGRYLRRWLIYAAMLGLYLSLRGYHSLDGDQTYRLPLLVHRQDPAVFADDPFVRAFDAFNPHRGALVVLDLFTRPFGLALGLFIIFVLTFAATCLGIDHLTRAIWPAAGPVVGPLAVGLILAAKAGNIGTNHLFEAMVLDRLMAFALGWLALADLVACPNQNPARIFAAIALATWIHPSVGLQLALVLAASTVLWTAPFLPERVSPRIAIGRVLGLACAVIPGLVFNLGPGSTLSGDMPPDLFWLLSVELQSPQHMLPHLWRMSQWLAWTGYFLLASIAFLRANRSAESSSELHSHGPGARIRLATVMVVILAGLGVSWVAIELLHNVRVTVFQPFRMATIARGIALICVAGRLVTLWHLGSVLARLRAVLITIALCGDWLFVMVTLAEIAVVICQGVQTRLGSQRFAQVVDWVVYSGALALGLNFLAHHDTEYGNRTLLVTLGLFAVGQFVQSIRNQRAPQAGRHFRFARVMLYLQPVAWAIPVASLLATWVPADYSGTGRSLVRGLVARCRFNEVPIDDVERLGAWCRQHTPLSARLVGPPGPKTLRLWSRRSVAFNRSASPYHAAGLADWFARFRDHVDFHGSTAEFVRAFVRDRHGFEARYNTRTAADWAALALRQGGATHVVAPAPLKTGQAASDSDAQSPLELLHVEGSYAVYKVKPELLAHRQR